MISREDIERLGQLARLNLSESEKEALTADISHILGYVGQVAAVSQEVGEPTAGVHRNIMREDAVRDAQDPLVGKEEAVRAQFPTREGNFNVVRKIIQKDE